MPTRFDQVKVSIVLTAPGADPALTACVRSALEQDHPAVEVVVVEGGGPETRWADLLESDRVRHLPGKFINLAAMYDAGIAAAGGEYVLLIYGDARRIELRRSAVQTLVMAAVRGDVPAGMVYADYERIEADGSTKDIHLLDWHPGRTRQEADFGPAVLFSAAALADVGGLDESLSVAYAYDLRLKIGERHRIVHVANRFAGSLYAVTTPAKAHNVFDYLLADRQAQIEFEQVFTGHLKRRGAYLEPGAFVRAVRYDADEQRRFAECVASVVIPVHDRPGFIGQAIESVQAQTVRNVEVIVVVNGGGKDATCQQVERYLPGGDRHKPDGPGVELLVVDLNNLGLCLNAGISRARGRYYVQLDSDDLLKPQAIEKLLQVFESDDTIGMVIGAYEVWNLNEQTGERVRDQGVPVVAHDEWTADNGRNNLLRVGGAGAPRSAPIKVIAEVGWFGVNDGAHCRNYGEDYDLVLRISEQYRIGRVTEPIYEVIRHSGGTDHNIDQATIDRNDEAKDAMRLEALRRRRRLNGLPADG
ncbi:MAG: glycosyltransferase [Phycisphaerae bacterium]